MHITKVVIRNYRCLRNCTTSLNDKLNIVVGDNECGKSTLLEAVHLTLSGQLNGRPLITEIHPQLFNQSAVREYIEGMKAGKPSPPPSILIELHFDAVPELAECKGTNNSLRENVPGAKLIIEFNEDYKTEYANYIAGPAIVRTVPIEYYAIRLRTFADSDITPRAIPIRPTLIDASTIRNNAAASRYVVDLVKDSLTRKEQVDLALSYRLTGSLMMRRWRPSMLNSPRRRISFAARHCRFRSIPPREQAGTPA